MLPSLVNVLLQIVQVIGLFGSCVTLSRVRSLLEPEKYKKRKIILTLCCHSNTVVNIHRTFGMDFYDCEL